MPRVPCLLAALLLFQPLLRAAAPGPLEDALGKSRGEAEHWAFTETLHISDGKGRDGGMLGFYG